MWQASFSARSTGKCGRHWLNGRQGNLTKTSARRGTTRPDTERNSAKKVQRFLTNSHGYRHLTPRLSDVGTIASVFGSTARSKTLDALIHEGSEMGWPLRRLAIGISLAAWAERVHISPTGPWLCLALLGNRRRTPRKTHSFCDVQCVVRNPSPACVGWQASQSAISVLAAAMAAAQFLSADQ